MISGKFATLCLLKIKVFWNKCYDVIISDVPKPIFYVAQSTIAGIYAYDISKGGGKKKVCI